MPEEKGSRPNSAKDRIRARRERLRAQGLRPVQHWVPESQRAKIRREAALLAKHPENAGIDDWIEVAIDPRDWS